jgi:hypothetical protein
LIQINGQTQNIDLIKVFRTLVALFDLKVPADHVRSLRAGRSSDMGRDFPGRALMARGKKAPAKKPVPPPKQRPQPPPEENLGAATSVRWKKGPQPTTTSHWTEDV